MHEVTLHREYHAFRIFSLNERSSACLAKRMHTIPFHFEQYTFSSYKTDTNVWLDRRKS